MARPLLSDVLSLCRDIADDIDQGAGIVIADDSHFWTLASRVQRRIFRELVKHGHESAYSEITRTVTSADTKINWALPVGQELPNDFIAPLRMWEKLSTDPITSYVLMDPRQSHLPDRASQDNIGEWLWVDESDGSGPSIHFLAPNTTRTVRIEYLREPAAFANSATALYVPGSIDAMASGILYYLVKRRGEATDASELAQEFSDDLSDLLKSYGKTQQRRVRQRRSWRWARWFRK